MVAREIVKECMKNRGCSAAQLAQKLGYSTPSGVTERLRKSPREMSVDIFLKMLGALNCGLVVVDYNDSDKMWEVTPQDSDTLPL